MNLRSIVAVSVVAFLAVACGQESATEADGAWVGTITTEGNVTTVVNESGSVWGGTGRGQVLGVAVEAGPPFGVPRVILEGPYWEGNGVQYDVMEDGRFLVMKSPQSATVGLPIQVVLNWFEELKQRVPTGR